jgi:predicted permease
MEVVMWHDLRQAIRTLRKHPGFVALAACVLALGIGLNTAIFSIVYAMLFRPFDVKAPEELVSIYQAPPRQRDRPHVLSTRYYDVLSQERQTFAETTAVGETSVMLRADGQPELVRGAAVLSNYFAVLGAQPALGRTLVPAEDDIATPERAVVISDALWRRRFESDPNIIGRQIAFVLDQIEVPYTIVGVMRPGFSGIADPWRRPEVWVTHAQARRQPARLWAGVMIARLQRGVSAEQVRALVSARGRHAYYSSSSARPEYEPRFHVLPTNDVRVPFDPAAVLVPKRLAGAMTIVVAMVLLVAAANIAGILLARGVGRAGEIAVRRVLGAGAGRILRQLLCESLLLAVAGGALGLLLANWLLDAFRMLTPAQFSLDVFLDTTSALFAAAVCLAASVLVGIMPARQAMRLDVLPWLAGAGSGQTRQTRRRLRHVITVPQVICSLVLLLVAGVYVRDLLKIELADVGYSTRNIMYAYPTLRTHEHERASRYQQAAPGTADGRTREERYAERTRRFHHQLLDRLRAMPGVADVAIATSLPLFERRGAPSWSAVPRELFQAGERKGAGTERSSVSPGYFRTLNIPLLAGRDFDDRDTIRSPKVAIVSASVAQRLWPGRDAVGRMLTLVNEYGAKDEKSESYEVIGVARDVKPVLYEGPHHPFVYLALGQEWRPWGAILARGTGDSRELIPAVRTAVASADPQADVVTLRTLSQIAGEILYPRRLAAAILAICAASTAWCRTPWRSAPARSACASRSAPSGATSSGWCCARGRPSQRSARAPGWRSGIWPSGSRRAGIWRCRPLISPRLF